MATTTTLTVISQAAEATRTLQALMPLITNFVERGEEATPESVRAALAGKDAALAAFDAEIKRQGG